MTRALRRNTGVVTSTELERFGFSGREVEGFVQHGDIRRVHRGVYGDGRTQLSDQGRKVAALLAVGHGSWIAGHAAAADWGLEPGVPAVIEVGVRAEHTPRHRGLRVKRVTSEPHPSEIRRRRGLRVSSVPRLLIEIAAGGATEEQLEVLIEKAVRKRLFNAKRLAEALERHAGERGTGVLRALCADHLPDPARKSGLERSFDRFLRKHPEIPEPQRNIKLGPWEIDCYWPDYQLALELDGRDYHVMVEEMDRDRRKDTWLQLQGLRIMRVTDRRWKLHRDEVHQDLLAMLALGRPSSTPARALLG